MDKQLYRIERRRAKAYEAYAYTPMHDTHADVNVLAPVKPVHDLAWAVGEMVRNPCTIYMCDDSDYAHRYDQADGLQYRHGVSGEWGACVYFSTKEHESTSWNRVEEKPAAPFPGTLEWARGVVRNGGAVWSVYPTQRYTTDSIQFKNGYIIKCDWSTVTDTFEWHLWGDREWLRALPDGTRVQGLAKRYTKQGEDLVDEKGLVRPIRSFKDSGWDLVREKENEPDLIDKATPHANHYDTWADTVDDRIDTISRQIEIHDNLMADLSARLAKVERENG